MAIRVTCDRCDDPIRVEANRYTIKMPTRAASSGMPPDDAYDLCERCAKNFADWINPPRSA